MRIAVVLLASLLSATVHAAEWRFGAGAAYATNIGDVADLYEDNLRAAGLQADVDIRVPIGVTLAGTYHWISDLRADVGVGPAFFITGDVDHFELPLSATVGYTFLSNRDISPYVRAGVVYHIVSGDASPSATPGVLIAAGLDFYRFALEVSLDRSEVDFDVLSCEGAGGGCTPALRKLNTYDVVLGFLWKF